MSNPRDEVGGVVRRFEAFTGWLGPLCFRRPLTTLAIALVLGGLALSSARRIKLDTDLAALLPETFPSVRALGQLKERFGATGFALVVARGQDRAGLERFAEDFATRARALPDVDFVQVKRSDAFFEQRALYYLEPEDLEEIQELVDETLRYHKARANPLFVDLDDEPPPSLDLGRYQARRSPLRRNLGGGGGARDTPYFVSAEGDLIALFVRPTREASDFAFTRRVMKALEQVVDDTDRAAFGLTSIELGGRYKKRLEQQQIIEGDLGKTSGLAIFLLILYIVVHFRRPAAVVLLILPLVLGLVWLLGVTALLFGVLNILTAFVGAILLGLGIDHGIHLLGRYQFERSTGLDPEAAVARAFANTGRGVVVAGLTTAVGFSGLAVSEFRAFHEFGVIAALGVAFVVVAYLTVLPALLALLGRLGGSLAVTTDPRFPIARRLVGAARPILLVSSLAFLAVGLLARRVAFDYDFRTLEGGDIPAYALDTVVDGILGRKQTPIVMLADSAEEEAEAARVLRERVATSSATSGVDFVITSGDVIPGRQDEKRALLSDLGRSLDAIPSEAVPEAERGRLERLREMCRAAPFGFEDLPEDIRRQFRGRGIVLIFPNVSLSDGLAVVRLATEIEDVPVGGGKKLSATGGAMVMADILRMVFRETPVVVGLTLALVLLSMWLLLGRLGVALFCLTPALLTVAATLGGAALLGVRLNYLNIVILPVLFGMAVDAGVHLVTRGALGATDVTAALAETGGAVWGASLTTAMGFGALLLAHHPGLESFGQLALIGLAAIVVSSLVWLTSLIAVLAARRRGATP